MDKIITFISLGLWTSYLVKAWFESTFVVHLLNLFRSKNNKLYTFQDFETWLMSKPFFFQSLLTCPICLSFHVSYLIVISYLYVGGKMDPADIFISIGVSAFISSYFNSKGNQTSNKEYETVTEEPEAVKETVELQKEQPKKIEGVKDMGGYLLEYDETGKAKLIGHTTIFTNYASRVYDKKEPCNFPACEELRKQYDIEISALEKSFEEKGVECKDCNKSGIKRKYYDIIKAQVNKPKT